MVTILKAELLSMTRLEWYQLQHSGDLAQGYVSVAVIPCLATANDLFFAKLEAEICPKKRGNMLWNRCPK